MHVAAAASPRLATAYSRAARHVLPRLVLGTRRAPHRRPPHRRWRGGNPRFGTPLLGRPPAAGACCGWVSAPHVHEWRWPAAAATAYRAQTPRDSPGSRGVFLCAIRYESRITPRTGSRLPADCPRAECAAVIRHLAKRPARPTRHLAERPTRPIRHLAERPTRAPETGSTPPPNRPRAGRARAAGLHASRHRHFGNSRHGNWPTALPQAAARCCPRSRTGFARHPAAMAQLPQHRGTCRLSRCVAPRAEQPVWPRVAAGRVPRGVPGSGCGKVRSGVGNRRRRLRWRHNRLGG
jgi:hypothetical protein